MLCVQANQWALFGKFNGSTTCGSKIGTSRSYARLGLHVTSNSERRRHVRVSPRANEPITVQLVGKGKGKFAEIWWARDISAGGMAVAIHHDVDTATLSSEVQIIVGLPGALAFKAMAQVRHISSSSLMFGVQFSSIEPANLAAIEAYVTTRVSEGGTVP